MNKKRDTVLIYGSGMMGCGIAVCSALAGNKTILYNKKEESLQRAAERVKKNLDELLSYNLCTQEQAEKAKQLISRSYQLDDVYDRVSMVIESVYEDLELKQDVFYALDKVLPKEVPLLSNTSGLRISDIASKTQFPERTLTTHFWLPPTLVPLVEVVVGDRSSQDLAYKISDELKRWGKSPVVVKKDLPGQLANRILQAIIREAVNIVETGLASAEDVDTAIKMGMALRFPVWGPLEHVDAVGVKLCKSVQDTVLPEISSCDHASQMFDDLLNEGMDGYKTGRGFYDWSKKSMDDLVEKRNNFIVYALKKIREA